MDTIKFSVIKYYPTSFIYKNVLIYFSVYNSTLKVYQSNDKLYTVNIFFKFEDKKENSNLEKELLNEFPRSTISHKPYGFEKFEMIINLSKDDLLLFNLKYKV